MASLPPKIDQRTYEDIVQQIEVLAEDFTNDVEGGGWKPPGAIEIEPKPELLSGFILNENIPTIIVEPTVANLTGRILNEEVDLGNNKIIKQGTLVNDNLAQKIVQVKGKERVKVLLLRNTLIDTTLAEEISQIEGLKQVKVKVRPPVVIEVERKNWLDQTLAEDIGNIKSGTVINEDIAQKITDQGRSKVKVKVETDAGQALIRIFATMVKLVSDRLNQVPEKNFLAFLDLIGGQLKPPQPAKVPLTFYLAEGSPVDGLVPAHTQVSAPPAEDAEEEIVFETDRELVVTTAQLQAVFVREPSQHKYSERTLEATGQKDAAFLAFAGDRPIEHSLYLTCPEIFNLPELANLKLVLTTDNTNQFPSDRLNWFYWDGSEWKEQSANRTSNGNKFTFTFTNLPILTDSEIQEKTGKWLQAKVTNLEVSSPEITNIQGEIKITKSDLVPDVCLFNSTPLDLTKDFYPFGEQPEFNDTFYLALHDQFVKPNTIITLDLISKLISPSSDLKITWEIGDGEEWKEITTENNSIVKWSSESPNFTKEITAQLEFSEKIPLPSTVNGETRYWIRARITQGHYGQPSQERKYAIYNEAATVSEVGEFREVSEVSESPSKTTIKIIGNATELFTENDVIKLVWIDDNNSEKREEYELTKIEGSTLTLNKEVSEKARANGTKIFRKFENYRVIKIIGNAAELFSENDVIRLVWIDDNNSEKREEYELTKIEGSTLILKTGVTDEKARAKGTKIFRRYTISETTPPIYDPPLVKSLKLTYEFTLTEDAIYFANNDFIYSHAKTKLKQKANLGDKLLTLAEVEGLTVGQFLTIKTENYKIQTIDSKLNQILLASTVTEDYPKNTPVKYSFRPFTTTIDKEPTLYLGFDQSFDNKTVTLYAQVQSPLPDELSKEIATETFLTEKVNKGEKILKLDDITGWEQEDILELELKTPSKPKQYFIYSIDTINQENKEITVKEDIQEDYTQGSRVIYPTQPKLVWEYSSNLGWQTLGVKDETKNFSGRGLIQFIAPADLSKIENFGQQLYWLRVRWQGGNFRVKPRLRCLLTNTIWAVQATTLKEEVLGSSNSDPNQVFVANQTPILKGQNLEVQEGQIPPELEADRVQVIRDDLGEIESVWIKWLEVPEFYGSTASDRHYTLDRQTGEIRFGDGLAGMIPPRGRNNIRLSLYRTGGGEQGNIAAETISELKTTIPYIDGVINLEPSAGGAQQETLDHLKERVPKQLRHRNRAVTAQDMADLAYEASTDVARVKVVTPDLMTSNFSPLNENFWLDPTKPDVSFEETLNHKKEKLNDDQKKSFDRMMREIKRRAGQVKLIILPDSRARQPVPSLALLEQVETFIRSRCEGTVDVIVTAPQWQEISVTATITPVSLEGVDRVRNSVKQILESFLHPLTGGSGKGWQFGRHPEKSDFYAIIQAIPGVDHVYSLEIDAGSTDANSSLNADTVIFSGNHTINVSSPRRK